MYLCSLNIYTHIGIRKTRNWVWYETFYYLFEFKVFRHEERAAQILSILTFPSESTTSGTPPQTTGLASASSENRLASSKPESQLTAFFQIPKSSAHRFRPSRHSRPRSHFLSGVFIVTSVIVSSTLHALENLDSMCTPN